MARQTAPNQINAYDFDHTIYKGDCSLHFYYFCLLHQPWLLMYLPYQFGHFLLFVLKLEDRNTFKSRFFVFLRGVKDIESIVGRFWGRNFQRIKQWYLETEHQNDVIISASPEFLLRPAFAQLGAQGLIATRMDAHTGKIHGNNCRGTEKVVRLKEFMPEASVQKAYTDSMSDMPLLSLAKERYVVKGDQVLTLETYARLSRLKKITIPDPVE